MNRKIIGLVYGLLTLFNSSSVFADGYLYYLNPDGNSIATVIKSTEKAFNNEVHFYLLQKNIAHAALGDDDIRNADLIGIKKIEPELKEHYEKQANRYLKDYLNDIPTEISLEHILSKLSYQDQCSLAQTNKHLNKTLSKNRAKILSSIKSKFQKLKDADPNLCLFSVTTTKGAALLEDGNVIRWDRTRRCLIEDECSRYNFDSKNIISLADQCSIDGVFIDQDGFPQRPKGPLAWKLVDKMGKQKFKALAVGLHSIIGILKETGELIGLNRFLRSGIPTPIQGRLAKAVFVYDNNFAVILDDGTLYVWNDAKEAHSPNLVPYEVQNDKFKSVAIGDRHFVAIRENGSLFAWGNNDKGQLNIPKELENMRVRSIEAGEDHTLALTEENRVFTWGSDNAFLTFVPDEIKNSKIKSIFAAPRDNFVVPEGKSLYSWRRKGTEIIPSLKQRQGRKFLIEVLE